MKYSVMISSDGCGRDTFTENTISKTYGKNGERKKEITQKIMSTKSDLKNNGKKLSIIFLNTIIRSKFIFILTF